MTMPNLIKSEFEEKNIQQNLEVTKCEKPLYCQTKIENGSTATIVDSTDEDQSTYKCEKKKLERLKTETASVVISEDEFHTTTPIEDYKSDCFKEFAIPVVEKQIPEISKQSQNGESSHSIQKPPRKSIKSELRKQIQDKNMSKNLESFENLLMLGSSVSARNVLGRNCDDITPRKCSSVKLFSSSHKERKRNSYTKGEAIFLDTESNQNNFTDADDRIRELTTMTIEEKVTKFFDEQESKNGEYNDFEYSNESTYGTFRKYLEILSSMDENGDSKIIRELVLSRYGGAIQNHLEKSASKRNHISLNSGISKESLRSIDSGNNSIGDELLVDNDSFPEGAFSIKVFEDILQETNNFNITKQIEEEIFSKIYEEYSEQEKKDLQIFLDDELETKIEYSCNTEEDVQSKVTEKHIQKKSPEKIMTSIEEISHVDNEEAPEKKETEENLMQKLFIQTATILEVSKALDFCKKFKEYSESIERVEAEHILLIASVRRGLILDKMTETECEDTNLDKNGFIRLTEIRIPLIANENNSKGARYFVCVFHCGYSVLTSGVLQPNNGLDLKINKSFIFEELSHNFEINVELYSIFIKASNKNKKSNAILKDVNNAFYNLRRYISSRRTSRNSTENCTMKKTCFVLCGKSRITRTTLQQKEFKIQTVYPANAFANSLTCEINHFVKLTNRASGFLTVGQHFNGTLVWNRQWCFLQNATLMFWDYPGRENEVRPNNLIDISRCMLQNISQADKSFCPRPRTLHLKLGPESGDEDFIYTNFYLSADNQDDFRYWSEQLNSVLTSLILWNSLKPYSCNTT